MTSEAGAASSSTAPGDPSGLLQTLQGHVEELRNFLQCGVCVKPMYEPFTLGCGHTFCYSCLTQWFASQQHRLSCPKCRASVRNEPGPAYLVREIVHYFMANAELLAINETTAEHREEQLAQAQLLENDKQNDDPENGGLFGGCFRRNGFFHAPIHDDDDGVERCPRCTWELEDGECLHCGYSNEDNDFSFDSDDSLSPDDIDDFESDESGGNSADMSVDAQLEATGLDLMYDLSEEGLYGNSEDDDDSEMAGFLDDGDFGDVDDNDDMDDSNESLIMDGAPQLPGNTPADPEVITITSQPDEDGNRQDDTNDSSHEPIDISDDNGEDQNSVSGSDSDSDSGSNSDVVTKGNRRRTSPDRGRIQKYTPRHQSASDQDEYHDDFDDGEDDDHVSSHNANSKEPVSDKEGFPRTRKTIQNYWNDDDDDEENEDEGYPGLTSEEDQTRASTSRPRLRAPI